MGKFNGLFEIFASTVASLWALLSVAPSIFSENHQKIFNET